jgi:hypothetical protein
MAFRRNWYSNSSFSCWWFNPPPNTGATEEYDGTSWATSPGSLGTARSETNASGTQTAGLCVGGYTPPITGATEEYDGTSWAAGGTLNTAIKNKASAGIQTATISFGGSPPITGATEEYDGTSWTIGTSLSTARYASGAAGSTSLALCFGGEAPPISAATEEWTGPGAAVTKTITVS